MSVLLTINDEQIDTQEALSIDILHDNHFLPHVIENVLIRQAAEKKGISNSAEELQVAVDELRYNRGLESVEKAKYWLKSNNLSLEAVQMGVDLMLLRNKLRNSFTESEVEAYFAEHKLEFDKVDLYSIRLSSKEKAEEILTQMKEEGLNFQAAAVQYSEDEDSKKLGGYVGQLTRNGVTGEIEAAVFKPTTGELIGPIKTDKGYNLFMVGEVYKADLQKEKGNIKLFLFQELLNKMKAEANVDYNVFAGIDA